MILDKRVVDRVCGYLFGEGHENVGNLFKAIYYIDNQQYIDKIPQNAKDFTNKLLDKVPSFAKLNINFAYSLAYKSHQAFFNAINAKPTDEKAEKDAEKAAAETLEKYGITTDKATGQTEQEGLQKAISDDGEKGIEGALLSNGLLAGNGNAQAIARNIKNIDTSLQRLQKSLKNVSAIADSLLSGIEKVKSDYSDSGYDYGRNLQLLDSRELILIDPRYRQQFAIKYAKGELLMETSEDKKGLGDLVIAIDTSASTEKKTKQGYQVIDLEMGIALGMAKIALRNKCKVKFILFESDPYLPSMWLKTKQEINKYFGSAFNNLVFGGTDFDNALVAMVKPLEQRQFTTARKPGLIFITDGYSDVKESTKKRVKAIQGKLGTKLYSYFVSSSDPREYSTDLVGLSTASYWVDDNKSVTQQIDCFTELSR